MKPLTAVGVLSTVVFVLGAGAWVARDRTAIRTVPRKVALDSSPSRDLELKLARLEGSVEELQREERQPAPANSVLAELPQQAPPPPPIRERMTPAEVESKLAVEHHLEQRDPQWSGGTEAKLREVFAGQVFAGTTLVEADCRATLCRAVVQSTSDAAFESFRESMVRTPPFDTEGFVTNVGSEQEPELVIYFAKPGESLQNLLPES